MEDSPVRPAAARAAAPRRAAAASKPKYVDSDRSVGTAVWGGQMGGLGAGQGGMVWECPPGLQRGSRGALQQ